MYRHMCAIVQICGYILLQYINAWHIDIDIDVYT